MLSSLSNHDTETLIAPLTKRGCLLDCFDGESNLRWALMFAYRVICNYVLREKSYNDKENIVGIALHIGV